MRRAIQLAERATGEQAPNPKVGAVIVYQGRVIGEGYHQVYGGGHAEVNAVNSVVEEDRQLLSSATMYVTLEPCFHHGKTPPCVELILKHQIPRVVIACTDPFEQVAGQSIQKLKAAGVEVTVGVLEAEAAWSLRRFFTRVEAKRPYILLKYAKTKDGFMGSPNERLAISNAWAQRLVHQWRSEEAAILVGTNTARLDNPQLTNRLYFGRNPLRLVIDRHLRLPQELHLFSDGLPTWIFTTQDPQEVQAKAASQLHYQQVEETRALLPQILEYLHQQKVGSVLVEGGSILLNSFLQQDLWDEARVFTSPNLLGKGVAAPKISEDHWRKSAVVGDNRLDYYYLNH